MAKTATKAASKSGKSAAHQKSERKRSAERKRQLEHTERNGAHAYAERVPIMADELADIGGSATVKELFKALSTGATGLFATERRVAATVRYDGRQESPMFDRIDGKITLRKRQRAASGKSKRSNGRVSRKRTRAAS